MNQQQRKFLVEKIQVETKLKIESLKSQKQEYPSASNFIFKSVLNETIDIQPKEVIIKALKEMALKSKEGENWLGQERGLLGSNKFVRMLIRQLIVMPQDYEEQLLIIESHNKSIEEKISKLYDELKTIEVRIFLASDKTLQKMINEVDDLGEISLMNTNLKMIEQ